MIFNKKLCPNSEFTSVTSDFEPALRESMREVWDEKNLMMIGCLFHFYQSIRRYLQTHGLLSLWEKNGRLQGLINAIPFIHLHEPIFYAAFQRVLRRLLDELSTHLIKDEIELFYKYIFKTYVNDNATYSPTSWSLQLSIGARNGSRFLTNNALEIMVIYLATP